MSKPLATTMWCPAVQMGNRWQLSVHRMRHTREDCRREFLRSTDDAGRPVKFVKVRIVEVEGAGWRPASGG